MRDLGGVDWETIKAKLLKSNSMFRNSEKKDVNCEMCYDMCWDVCNKWSRMDDQKGGK